MPTNVELYTQIDEQITDKTTAASISPTNVGENIKAAIEYTDQEVAAMQVPYKSYIAVLSQSGTSSPTFTVLFNNTGITPSIGYVAVGVTGIIFAGADINKVVVIHSNKCQSAKNMHQNYYITGNTIFSRTYNLVNGAYENDMLLNTPIEIRIYN